MKRLPLIVLYLMMGIAITACTSVDDAPGVASLESASQPESQNTTDTGNVSPESEVEKAVLAFTRCLRDEGLDAPDPTFDGLGNPQFPRLAMDIGPDATAEQREDFDAETARLEEALEACQPHLDGVVMVAPDPDIEDAALKYAACMRDNGIDIPDPTFSEGGINFGNVDATTDEYAAADKVCRSVFTE